MSTPLSPKTPAFHQYGKTGLYLFSFLSFTTFCIYVVVHILLYEKANFQFDEIVALLKMIAAEFAVTACLMMLLFIAEWVVSKLSAHSLKRLAFK
jgi:hypothetical protein